LEDSDDEMEACHCIPLHPIASHCHVPCISRMVFRQVQCRVVESLRGSSWLRDTACWR
jgi:hypothetical protein